MAIFYDFSGGMESAAMLVLERERILEKGAIVRLADTGKQFPEAALSFRQVEFRLGLEIVTPKPRITFDEFLFARGGIVKRGTTDCSRRMKRTNLSRHAALFPKPWEINLGYNADEQERAEAWTDRNERPWCHWRFPLIEAGVTREMTFDIAERAGLSIVVEMYRKMGRMDCFWCGNQTEKQALRVADLYPLLAIEWIKAEAIKGHSFMKVSLATLLENRGRQGLLELAPSACGCFGGDADYFEPEGLQVPR